MTHLYSTARLSTLLDFSTLHDTSRHCTLQNMIIPLKTLEKLPSLRQELAYAPFKGGMGGVRIGVKPLGDKPWFLLDEDEQIQLALKQQVCWRGAPKKEYFQQVEGSEAAQEEVHKAIFAWLTEAYPDRYAEFAGRVIWAQKHLGMAPLLTISMCVQDDLCIVEKVDGEYIMTAASVCFPTSWKVEEKIGKSVNWIHANSDDGPIGTEKFRAAMDGKIAATTEEIVERFNWFVYRDPILRHRHLNTIYDPEWDDREINEYNAGARLHLRYERQTLRRFPETGALLFTIRPYVDPLRKLKEEHPEMLADFATAYCKHKHEIGKPWKSWEDAMWCYLDRRPGCRRWW